MKRDAAFDQMLVAEGSLKAKKKGVRKRDRIFEMRHAPASAGSVCANCAWPTRYGRIEYANEFFCRPECAKQKHHITGRVHVVYPEKPKGGSVA